MFSIITTCKRLQKTEAAIFQCWQCFSEGFPFHQANVTQLKSIGLFDFIEINYALKTFYFYSINNADLTNDVIVKTSFRSITLVCFGLLTPNLVYG